MKRIELPGKYNPVYEKKKKYDDMIHRKNTNKFKTILEKDFLNTGQPRSILFELIFTWFIKENEEDQCFLNLILSYLWVD